MEIRTMKISEVGTEMLHKFNRCQEVSQKWVKDEDKWVLKDVSEARGWDNDKKEWLINGFRLCLEQGGVLIGAFEEEELIGFVLLDGKLCGSASQYANLTMLFVTKEKRALGIGSKLFSAACEAAAQLGADKLFISAYSAKDTIEFYIKRGCIDTIEVIQEFIDAPDDWYLEYKL